jgi:SAM-dependent methyltransferase
MRNLDHSFAQYSGPQDPLTCKICDSGRIKLLYRIRDYDIYRCGDCGFGQVYVSSEELHGLYDEAYFSGERANFRQMADAPLPAAMRYWLDEFLPARRSGVSLNLLEIGPGLSGAVARHLRLARPDIAYEAVEFSEYAAAHLREQGFVVHAGVISAQRTRSDCGGRFDLVIGTEVIEHDPDPKAFADAVYECLKPGGICRFTTGNLDGFMARWHKQKWYYFDPPVHVSYFSPRAVRRLFLGAGFRNVDSYRTGFNYIDLKLRTRLPGILTVAHLLSIPTGMVIRASK